MTLTLDVGGGTASIRLSNVALGARIGAASSPTASRGATPGHLAAEHLDPALVSFASLADGTICGDVSAASLAKLPVPKSIASGGVIACEEGYGAENSMLDVLVGGCKVLLLSVIHGTQPDHVDPRAPSSGAGGPYAFTVGDDKAVNGCTDRGGGAADLASCLAASAYSSYLQFTSGRVVAK
jgi:hypothetical protein